MENDFLAVISENLKSLRQRRNLSLEKTAKICGISKSMIAQIERCEVNPTITTVGKIADGFNVSITDLLYKPKPEVLFFPRENFRQTTSSDNQIRTIKILPFDTDRRFEHSLIEIDAAGKSDVNPGPENTQTYITVFKGTIDIIFNEQSYSLSSGDMLKFKSKINYSIFNTGKKSCRLSKIIHFPIE